MADFGIRFLLCNVFICVIIGMILIAKRVLRNHLTSRMQFHVWFLLLGLLAVPFMPFRLTMFSEIFLWLGRLKNTAASNIGAFTKTSLHTNTSGTAAQINDFTLSVSSQTPSTVGVVLCAIWLIGILAMLILVIKSKARLNALKKTALPLQNQEIRILYSSCLREMHIKRDIPIYSTAFLKSPIIVGLFHPCIYLPIHLISDYGNAAAPYDAGLDKADMLRPIRHMLLHELQHYKHKDACTSYLMNLFGVLYWFNPFVWHALKEMRCDREVACDASVLKLLNEGDYVDYGNTLINFAEKISLTPFPFASGLGGNLKQMKRRISNIASYKKPSIWKRVKGAAAFCMIAALLLGVAPMLSTYAADQNYYHWDMSSENITAVDLSAYFNGYDGSFVLYDLDSDAWSIYNMTHAAARTAPESTYKIYDALFGLEEGIIAPDDSFIAWNGEHYPYEAWNADQNLRSAMRSSVNWYFQEIDQKLGKAAIKRYVQEIGYGNENTSADISSYWMQSSLKISPVEQVELLTKLYSNSFGFSAKHVNAVKNSICLNSSESEQLYGKTGTGRVDGQDINGWFIGYAEADGHAYFFATNIQSSANANGSNAMDITMSILSDMNIYST